MMPSSSARNIEPLRIPFSIPAPAGPLARFVYSFIIYTPMSRILIDAGVAGRRSCYSVICSDPAGGRRIFPR